MAAGITEHELLAKFTAGGLHGNHSGCLHGVYDFDEPASHASNSGGGTDVGGACVATGGTGAAPRR